MISTCQGETEVPLSGVLSQWAIGEPQLLGGRLVAVGVSRRSYPQTDIHLLPRAVAPSQKIELGLSPPASKQARWSHGLNGRLVRP